MESSTSEKWISSIYFIEFVEYPYFFWIFNWFIIVTTSWYSQKLSLTSYREKMKIYINEGKFSFMVKFIQGVYIFFWASLFLWWAGLFVYVLHRELLLFAWVLNLLFLFLGRQILLYFFLEIPLSRWISSLDAVSIFKLFLWEFSYLRVFLVLLLLYILNYIFFLYYSYFYNG